MNFKFHKLQKKMHGAFLSFYDYIFYVHVSILIEVLAPQKTLYEVCWSGSCKIPKGASAAGEQKGELCKEE